MLNHSQEPNLGYIFYPYEGTDHPGHPQLDIIIQAVPTFKHYDPEKVNFRIVSAENAIQDISIRHPWTYENRFRVCAGLIILSDRNGKRVEAFSFGGELEIRKEAENTNCSLKSPAPIFALFEPNNLSAWFVDEIEILLAKQKAHWNPQHPHDFETHLATVEPFRLYASCLQALMTLVAGKHFAPEGVEFEGQHFVQNEIKRFRDKSEWPVLVPTLDQLFEVGKNS